MAQAKKTGSRRSPRRAAASSQSATGAAAGLERLSQLLNRLTDLLNQVIEKYVPHDLAETKSRARSLFNDQVPKAQKLVARIRTELPRSPLPKSAIDNLDGVLDRLAQRLEPPKPRKTVRRTVKRKASP